MSYKIELTGSEISKKLNLVDTNTAAINSEIDRATNAENINAASISEEITRAKAAEAANALAISKNIDSIKSILVGISDIVDSDGNLMTTDSISIRTGSTDVEFVDLGLPSGTLWAKCNLGASTEKEFGLYFQYGDTVGYTGTEAAAHSYWKTLPANNGNEDPDYTAIKEWLAKAAENGLLKDTFDAAYQHSNGAMLIPTKEQWLELLNNTSYEHTGASLTFTSLVDSSKYIYIPYASYWNSGRNPDSDQPLGTNFTFWTKSTGGSDYGVYVFSGYDGGWSVQEFTLYTNPTAYSIRPVKTSTIKVNLPTKSGIMALKEEVLEETTRAMAAEEVNANAISTEYLRAIKAEKTLTTSIANLEDKVPTMWVNILATKDTAVMADGVRVEIPAYTNTVIKDFKTFALADNTPNPKCITRFDIHYNGIAKVTGWLPIKYYQPTDETVKNDYGLASLTNLDVSCWDISEVTSLSCMFYLLKLVTSLDVSGFDTSKVTNMSIMFTNCCALASLDVSGFDTSKVTNMRSMFGGCFHLTSLDVSKWDTSNVVNMSDIFRWDGLLTALDLSNWDTSSVTSWDDMFYGCSSLTDITFGEGFGKAKASGLTLDLSTCGSNKSYVLTDNTYNSMLTMYDRATNGLPTMTIKFNAKHNLPDGFVAAMTARGYTITQ